METKQTTCKNCEREFEEGFEFCPYCGQKAKDELTIRVLFYNTISNYFSFDARFFKSFIPLMLKPGYLARKFVGGKRLMYLHPAQMYLFISVVFFFLFTILTRPQAEKIDAALRKTLEVPIIDESVLKDNKIDSIEIENILKPLKENQGVFGIKEEDFKVLDSVIKNEVKTNGNNLSFEFDKKKLDSLIAIDAEEKEIYLAMGLESDTGTFKRRVYSQALKFYKKRDGGSFLNSIRDSIPLAMFVLLPIFALLLKIFYWKRAAFAHHLVFSFYYFSFLFTVFSLIIVTNFIWNIPDWIDWLIAVSSFFYLFFAVRRFYEQGWFVSFFKAGIVSFMFLSMVLPFSALIIAFVTFMFY